MKKLIITAVILLIVGGCAVGAGYAKGGSFQSAVELETTDRVYTPEEDVAVPSEIELNLRQRYTLEIRRDSNRFFVEYTDYEEYPASVGMQNGKFIFDDYRSQKIDRTWFGEAWFGEFYTVLKITLHLPLDISPDLSLSTSYPSNLLLERGSYRSLTLDSSSSCDIVLNNVQADSLIIKTSGNLKFDAKQLDCNSVNVKTSGFAEVTMAGTAENVVLNTSGTLQFEGKELNCKNASVKSSGYTKCIVAVQDTLSIDCSGTIIMTYYGDPAVDKQISGYQDIKRGEPMD